MGKETISICALLLLGACVTETATDGTDFESEIEDLAEDEAEVSSEVIWQALELSPAEAIAFRGGATAASLNLGTSVRTVTGGIAISHCVKGTCPAGTPPGNQLISREIYALSNNGETKFADWVAYRPTRESIETSSGLGRGWKRDPLLDKSVTLEPNPDDYKGANRALGVERGHLAPLTLFAGTEYWRTTNYYSNIVPMQGAMNRGPWENLEAAEKQAAYDFREVFVLTGPLYEIDMTCEPALPAAERAGCLPNADENHQVPSGYWKVVTNKTGSKKAAFIIPQTAGSRQSHCEFGSSVDEIEARTGLTLFPGLTWSRERSFYNELGC
ncbi:MAG: DNA/RNA non-specific endonuclease [Pseudomonadota bacterium]